MAEIRASGDLVNVGDRLTSQVVELTDDRDATAPSLYVRVEIIDGAPQCREFRLSCPEGADEIRSTDVKIRMGGRWTGIDELVEQVVSRMVRYRVGDDGNPVLIVPTDPMTSTSTRSMLRAATRAKRSRLGPELWAEVAEVYRANPTAPTKAVAEHFGLAHRTGALWVQKARASGVLGPSASGKAGEH